MKIKDIVKITHGRLLSGNPEIRIEPGRISTDTRKLAAGDLFLALKGPNFDGNTFVEDALKKGASGAILTDYRLPVTNYNKVIIQVKDTTKAYQDIAGYHRRAFDIPVIAVTGSNGKTTTKEMIAAILSKKYSVLKNTGTENNHIGVPSTLLRLKPSHDICVLELGTNRMGEIRSLAGFASPTVAVITNVGHSHLESLGDLNGVGSEKVELVKSLDEKGGLAVLNGDDRYLRKIGDSRLDILRFGFNETNDFFAEALRPSGEGLTFIVNDSWVFGLNLCGSHNIYNALAAIAAASRFGVGYKDMREALLAYRPERMRLDVKKMKRFDLINDSYNSNPLSMQAALEAIRLYPARSKWVVSADMLELGRHAVRLHKLIGKKIAGAGIDGLLTYGELSRHTYSRAAESGMRKGRLWHCSSHGQIADILNKVTRPGDVVLLKGSRGMKMEEVLRNLE